MLALILLICLALGTAPLFSRGWISYGVLTAIPALILSWLWIDGFREGLNGPDSDAGAALAGGIYFIVCAIFACTAFGRLMSLSLNQFAAWPRRKALAWELMPLLLLASTPFWIAVIIRPGG